MKNTSRRNFLKTAGLGLGSLAAIEAAHAAEKPKKNAAAPGVKFSKPAWHHLGMVTYNLGADWDIATILKNCTEAQFEGVELRTTHKHGVEVSLRKAERGEVKRRFADSPVKLWSLGSAFDFHTSDRAKLRQDIEATKEYISLAHDVGATGVKVRPNGLPKEVPVEKTLECFVETIWFAVRL